MAASYSVIKSEVHQVYKRRSQGWLKHLDFILLDLISLHIAFVLAYFARNGMGSWPYAITEYRMIAGIITIVDSLAIVLLNTMGGVMHRGYYKEFAQTAKHAALVLAIVMAYMFSLQLGAAYSRIVVYLMAFFYTIISYATRMVWKKFFARRKYLRMQRSLLIVTTEALAAEVIQALRTRRDDVIKLLGLVILDRDMQGMAAQGLPVVANKDNAAEYLLREWVDEVYIHLPEGRCAGISKPTEFIGHCLEMGLTVHTYLAEPFGINGEKQTIERIGKYTVLTTSMNIATPLQGLIKRTMDIIGGFVGCLLTGVILLFIGPIIYRQSPGPVIFRQQRIGRNGKRFICYKIRSMYLDAEERKKEFLKDNRVSSGMMFKLTWDPRIIGNRQLPDGTKKTGIGEFIRRTSLDEFPQFFNVLKGDMSLVGTRPPTVDEWEKYEMSHRARLAMKPGITGLWQISGRSNITDFDEVVKLDTKYIYDWSPGLDLRILLKTFGAVFKKNGAM